MTSAEIAITRCPDCGTDLAPTLLACPRCDRLIHGVRLKNLATEAEEATRLKDLSRALATWRQALELLPPHSRQSETVLTRISELSRSVPTSWSTMGARKSHASHASWVKRGGTFGAGALLLWKFKFVLAFVLTKGKLLLLGLTKSTTLFSMFLSLGVYWTAWGWKFALGLVLSMYVHEMGHVATLQRYGIKATAPMFIPGLGAMVRMKQYPANPSEDARVGLAGQLWGVGAALVAFIVFRATAIPIWGAFARVTAWLNLFNLIPVWQLDGGRGFRALSRNQRWSLVGVIAVTWLVTREGLLGLVLLFAILNVWASQSASEGDRTTFITFVFLVVGLSALCLNGVHGSY